VLRSPRAPSGAMAAHGAAGESPSLTLSRSADSGDGSPASGGSGGACHPAMPAVGRALLLTSESDESSIRADGSSSDPSAKPERYALDTSDESHETVNYDDQFAAEDQLNDVVVGPCPVSASRDPLPATSKTDEDKVDDTVHGQPVNDGSLYEGSPKPQSYSPGAFAYGDSGNGEQQEGPGTGSAHGATTPTPTPTATTSSTARDAPAAAPAAAPARARVPTMSVVAVVVVTHTYVIRHILRHRILNKF